MFALSNKARTSFAGGTGPDDRESLKTHLQYLCFFSKGGGVRNRREAWEIGGAVRSAVLCADRKDGTTQYFWGTVGGNCSVQLRGYPAQWSRTCIETLTDLNSRGPNNEGDRV